MALTLSQIEQAVYREPFEPYRVLLEGGEEITVTKPRKAVASGEHLAVVGQSRRPDKVTKIGLRIVRLDSVSAIERLDEVNGGRRAASKKRP
jgi:hypothetical protein